MNMVGHCGGPCDVVERCAVSDRQRLSLYSFLRDFESEQIFGA